MYYTYILRCEDNSLYTGIAADIKKRLSQHFKKTSGCAKYTRSRHPVSLEAVWESLDRSSASKLEYRIKKLAKTDKQLLIQTNDMTALKDIDVLIYRRMTHNEIGGIQRWIQEKLLKNITDMTASAPDRKR